MRHHFNRSRSGGPHEDMFPYRSPDAPQLDDMIGRRLQRHYQEIEDQPLPDRLNTLLRALDGAQTGAGGGPRR